MHRLDNKNLFMVRDVIVEVNNLIVRRQYDRAVRIIKAVRWNEKIFEAFLESFYAYVSSKNRNNVTTLIDVLNHHKFDRNLLGMMSVQWLAYHMIMDDVDADVLVPLIDLALKYAEAGQLNKMLYGRYNTTIDANVKCLLKCLNESQLSVLIPSLMNIYYDRHDACMMYYLADTQPAYFYQTLWNMGDRQRQVIISILAMTTDAQREQFTRAMNPFAYEADRIDYEAGLLTCAQIQSRKSYRFMPVVLKEFEEFEKFIEVLKLAASPVRERFILAGGGHWVCGDIEVDSDGRLQCLLIDSLGSVRAEIQGEFEDSIAMGAGTIIRLAKQHFNEMTIYFTEDKRQSDPVSCKVSSLDDTMHLFTLEQYLPSSLGCKNLFEYLASQADSQTWINEDGVVVKTCHLPVSLLRSTQSRNLLNVVLPNKSTEEQNLIINKKSETAYESAKKYFKYDHCEYKKINTRLDVKFHKMAERNVDYLLSRSMDEVHHAKQLFTLESCKNRLLKQHSAPSVNMGLSLFAHQPVQDEQPEIKKTTAEQHISI